MEIVRESIAKDMETESMETISGAGNWNLTIQMEEDGVTLLRCHTPDERAVLPETVWGLPVIALGDRALSPDTGGQTGDSTVADSITPDSITAGENKRGARQLQITCGPAGAAEWNNARLRDLTLPRTLRRVGNYALYNCRALQTIRLFDSVQIWGNGVLMNCRELDSIQISRNGQSGAGSGENGHWSGGAETGDNGTTAYFAGELNRELDISVLSSDQLLLRLIFPEYRESYEENCPAHHFDYVIEGAGYPYHHCFHQRRLNLLEYDNLWTKSRDLEPMTAIRLAYWRLRCPMELRPEAAERYRAFLRSYLSDAAAWRIADRDVSGLRFLLREIPPERETLARCLSLAREQGLTEAVALLLEEQRQRFSQADYNRFAL